MSALSAHEIASNARAAFDAVFSSGDPYGELFTSGVERRTVLFPVYYSLDRNQFAAIAEAARALGEGRAYLHDIEMWKDLGWAPTRRQFLSIDLTDFRTYRTLPGGLEIVKTALYSPQGRWGLQISDEYHAVVGGPGAFIEVLLERLPKSEEEMLDEWLALWREYRTLGFDTEWLEKQIPHLFEDRKARRLLASFGE